MDTPNNVTGESSGGNLTEKVKGSQQDHKMQHNDGKDSFLGSLLGLPVEL